MSSEEKTPASASASAGADAADATSSTTPAPTTEAAEAPATKAADTTTTPAAPAADAEQAKAKSSEEKPAEAAPAEAAPAASKAAGKAPAAASSSTGATPKPKVKKATGKNYNTDPALWIYTSLTAGNMHIVTATSRLETILRANRVPFKATDLATDEKARMLWGRRAGKTAEGKPRRLPALVQMGMVLGDLSEIEEWNEYGELKQHVKIYYDEFTQPKKGSVAPVPKYKQPANKEAHPPAVLNPPPAAPPMPSAAQLQAQKIANAVSGAHAEKKQQPKQPKQGVKSVAEEAADKANAKAQAARKARIEALREKVHGAKGEEGEAAAKSPTSPTAAAAADPAEPPSEGMAGLSVATSSPGAGAGLQSPTSGAWREGADGGAAASLGDAMRTVQSPTSSSWKPPAETSLFAGARVRSASVEEIKEIEAREAIKEEPEPEEEGKVDKN